jgi:hypothetical protein
MLGDLTSLFFGLAIIYSQKVIIKKLKVLRSCDLKRFSIAIIQPKFKEKIPDFYPQWCHVK